MRKLRFLLAAIMIAGVLVPSTAAKAYDPGYNFNFIISDDALLDYTSMSQSVIQQFLEAHGSRLATQTFGGKSAAQVIYESAQTDKINPKVILVTLQKEMSLIDDDGYTSEASYQNGLKIAMGYGCPDGAACDSDFFGFTNQVSLATHAFRRFFNNIIAKGNTGYGIYPSAWGPGIPTQLPCINDESTLYGFCANNSMPTTVTPANYVTSALYTYTPHFHGNYNFWKIWNRYGFNFQRLYPDGSLLKAQGTSTIYIIQNGQKRKFASMTAFLSRYSSKNVITVPPDHLIQYENGRDIAFANYSLLASPKGGIYLLVNDIKRPIISSAVFRSAGFSKDEVTKVKWTDLNQFPDGDPITAENIYPAGRLLQNKKTGGVFFVKDGIRHPVYSKLVYKDQFGLQKAIRVAPAQLDRYAVGAPVGFRDGDLLQSKTNGKVYFVSNGYLLPISSPTTFAAYRFSWANVIKVDNASLAVHQIGPELNSDFTVQTASR